MSDEESPKEGEFAKFRPIEKLAPFDKKFEYNFESDIFFLRSRTYLPELGLDFHKPTLRLFQSDAKENFYPHLPSLPFEEKIRLELTFEISGNTPPTTAELTYLCEREHGNTNYLLPISDYLIDNSKPGDVILVEGTDAKKKVDLKEKPQYSFVKNQVEVFGWDNMELFNKSDRLFDELSWVNKQLLGDEVPEEEKFHLRFYRDHDLRARIQQVAIIERNDSLKKTIEEVKKTNPTGRIFVILGENHIDKDPSIIEFSEQFPYAILKPKVIPDLGKQNLFTDK